MSVLLLCVVDRGVVRGVTQLHDVVYIVCSSSSTIERFNATTHEQLTDIIVEGLSDPTDIAACEQTSRVYVADSEECVCRVSSDGKDMKCCWKKSPSDMLRPHTLSVTSSRLLVTSPLTKQLMQLDEAGKELRHVRLLHYMYPSHAVESPTGTFVVSHWTTQVKQNQWQYQYQVSEVNTEGQVLRQFSRSHLSSLDLDFFLGFIHIAVDSRGIIFVADSSNRRILLLNAQLALRGVIIYGHQLNYEGPRRLCYHEQSGRLMVGCGDSDRVAVVFDVLER